MIPGSVFRSFRMYMYARFDVFNRRWSFKRFKRSKYNNQNTSHSTGKICCIRITKLRVLDLRW